MALMIKSPTRCPFCGGDKVALIVEDNYAVLQCRECDREWSLDGPDSVEENLTKSLDEWDYKVKLKNHGRCVVCGSTNDVRG